MFTNRQLQIFSYLLSSHVPVTSLFLGDMLDVSTKTIQTEIKEMNSLLDQDNRIEYDPQSGYHLLRKSPEFLNKLKDEMLENQRISGISDRGSFILLILAFEKGYISMEDLANRLYLSKTAISKELEESWRIRRTVHVSHTKGIKLSIVESEIRLLLSKTVTLNNRMFDMLNLHSLGKKYYYGIQKTLENEFSEHLYIVSGDQLVQFRQYLFFTIIRNKQEFTIESQSKDVRISDLMWAIADKLRRMHGVNLSKNDLIGTQVKLNQLNLLYTNNYPNTYKKKIHYWEEKLEEFLLALQVNFRIELKLDTHWRKMFFLHMVKLSVRTKRGEYQINFYKRKINQKYPFTAQIIRDYFLPIFNIDIKDSEAAYIILYFGDLLESDIGKYETLLVSDEKPSVLNPIVNFLNTLGQALHLDTVHILPIYRYNQNQSFYNRIYQIIFTTEDILAITQENSILIKKLMKKSDVNWLRKQTNSLIDKMKTLIPQLCWGELSKQ